MDGSPKPRAQPSNDLYERLTAGTDLPPFRWDSRKQVRPHSSMPFSEAKSIATRQDTTTKVDDSGSEIDKDDEFLASSGVLSAGDRTFGR